MGSILPQQRLPLSKKDTQWKKDNINYWVDNALFHGRSYTDMMVLYRAAEGQLVPGDYKYILNPYNTDDEKLTRFPSKLRNYDILQPVIELFLGENSKKPLNAQVVAENADSKSAYLDALQNKVRNILAQQAINAMNQAGLETGMPSQDTPDINQVVQQFSENWKDDRAIKGQEALNYIKRYQDLDEKVQQALYHWLVVGRVFSFRFIEADDPAYEIVAPPDLWFMKSDRSEFVEDGSAAVRKRRMLLSDIIDKYRGRLAEDDLKFLEDQQQGLTSVEGSGYVHLSSDDMSAVKYQYGYYTGGYTDVFHVNWKSGKKVGILKYVDPMGQPQEIEVDETYELDTTKGDIEIEWQWVTETWEGDRIGDRIYTKDIAMPTIVQNEKLMYNGRIETTVTGELNSIVKRGLVHQALHNVYHYRRELTINRNKDKIMMLPLGLIPNKFGKDPMDKFMYYLEANSVGWIDETKPNAAQIMSSLKSLDMGLYQYIEGMTRVINDVKNEWWDSVGVNRQRYGDSQASDGKAVTEQAIFRSSIISAERNRKFFKFLEKDYNQLLEQSKYAWINGKRASYVGSDGRLVHLEVDPDDYTNAEMGVFVINADVEAEKLKNLKDYAFGLAQKSPDPSAQVIVAEVIDSENFSSVKEIIKKVTKIEQARIDQENQANRDTQKYISDQAAKTAQDDLEMQKYKADKAYQAAVDAAYIRAGDEGEVADEEPDNDGDDSSQLAREKMQQDKEKTYVNAGLAREKMASAERIAKDRNKNKAK